MRKGRLHGQPSNLVKGPVCMSVRPSALCRCGPGARGQRTSSEDVRFERFDFGVEMVEQERSPGREVPAKVVRRVGRRIGAVLGNQSLQLVHTLVYHIVFFLMVVSELRHPLGEYRKDMAVPVAKVRSGRTE